MHLETCYPIEAVEVTEATKANGTNMALKALICSLWARKLGLLHVECALKGHMEDMEASEAIEAMEAVEAASNKTTILYSFHSS